MAHRQKIASIKYVVRFDGEDGTAANDKHRVCGQVGFRGWT